MPILIGTGGLPEPPSDMVRGLRQVHPSLGVRFCPLPSGAVWGVTREWDDADPRRAMARDGRIDPHSTYDIIAWVPVRMSPSDVPGYIANNIRQHTDKKELLSLLDNMDAYNRDQTGAAAQADLEESFNVVEVMGSKLFDGIIEPNAKVMNAGIPDAAVDSTETPPPPDVPPCAPCDEEKAVRKKAGKKARR